MPIRQLPQDVAAKIAAGEVVERPASVVKELIENALDANAHTIRLEISGGGLDLIRVSDDGNGIAVDEMALAFARHATSKIDSLADLERIATLGFRGEALASIAAVARVSLLSRPRDSATGTQLNVDEGALGQVIPAGAPPGTTISIRGLFASVPARLKFLKTRATETAHCLRLLEQYALAWPSVRFTAISEGRQVFSTPGDGKLLSAIVAVYGLRVAEQLVALDDETASDTEATDSPPQTGGAASQRPERPERPERPQVSGYVSRPSCYKATRQFISFFVNGRWVQSRTLSYAVEEAYHSLLLTGRHPVAVINIALDPAEMDVNVHPAKTEVRFLRERMVYAAVQRAVRAAVLATAETPELSGRAFGAPVWSAPESAPSATLAGVQLEASQLPGTATDSLWRGTGGTTGESAARGAAGGFALPGVAADGMVGGKKLPALRVLGQVSQSYIITEGPDGVYMVDQHAAHERILLEKMIAEWRARGVSSQLLLEPQTVELAAIEHESVEEHLDQLRGIGFEIEPFGGDAMLVRAVPAIISTQAHPQSLRELLLELVGADSEAASHGETWEEHALANVACKAAIKAGQTLSPEEQREMIRQLEQVDAHQSCCHGRPTMVHLSLAALEREFDRR
ncbi:MAG TPA: DNA mismatch repair endonuclease MutL [Ktedonobacterales bacterium]|nr:DNA mismatch repair endonuclease MutL [Ktedonobacterales bacterium]